MAEEEKYSLQEAQEEAEKLQQKIGSGEAKDYQEAEEQVDQETKEAEQQVFRLAMEGDIRGALHFRDEHQLKISDSDIAQSLIEAGQGWAVAKNLSKFQGLDHKHIAEKLIDNEMGWAVAHYLSNFQGLEHKYIAERLIGAGQGRAVADYLSKFQGLDHKDIADKLIGAGEGSAVAENLSKFQGLDSHIAEKLIGAGEGRAVAKNLSNFQGLDSYIAEKLIGAGEGWAVAGNLSKFQGLDHKDIAKRLIGAGEGRAVAYYLYDFQGLDHKDIAKRLIGAGEGRAVAEYLYKFQGLDSHIAEKLIDDGEVSAVAHHLSNFQGLDSHIAERLIGAGYHWAVAINLSNFQGLDSHIAEKLIGAGEGSAVAENLSKFQGLDHKDIAERLINAGEGRAVAENLSNFQGLDHKYIAEKLIGAGQGGVIARYLSNFQGLDHKYIAEKLIGAGEGWAVAGNLSKFQGLDHKDIAKRLIGAGEGRAVAYYLYDFQGLDHKDIAERLINAGEGRAVAINLSKFQGLDHKDIAERLINAGEGRAVAENLYKFQGLDSHIAEKLIDDGEVSAVAHYLSNFQGLNTEVAKKLIEAGQGEAVAKHLSIFEGLNTEVAKKLIEAGEVSAVAENLYNFQGLDSHIAEELIDAGEGSAVLDNIERFAGLDISVLSRLPFSHYSYSRYLESQDEESITPEHLKLKEILEQTCLLSNELPEGVLQRDNWNAEELAEEAFPNIQDAAPASELLELGFSPLQLLRYADRDNLSRHDAFLASADIAALFKKSDLSVEDFYQNILWQVKMDDSSYEEGTAHHYLNALANRGIPTLEEIHNQIKEYSPQVQEEAKSIIADFKSNEDIFANWRSLKAFYEKCNIIQNEIETLAKIAELKEKGKDKLAEWYRLIAKSKNVSTSALNDFIARPDRFFEAEATHTDPELHEAKKPSNYYRIPNLDLTAEELRDALVEGAIDKVAAIPPMEISYEIAPKGKYLRSAIQDLEIAPRASLLLGSRKQNIEGLAADVPKLFSELNKLLRESQPPMNVNQFLSGEVQPDEATSEKIRALLDSCRLRGDLVIEKGERYLATIHPKSSPFGVLAGNDTACCMPFGDGKAVLYMMNPVCAQFTIQKEKEDGTRRTLVQSVMTLNYPIPGHSVPELIELLQSERDISQVLPDEALLNQRKLILVGDNAEAAPNFKSDLVTAGELSELLYGDFFARYLEQITSPEGRVNTTQIQIGLNSDVLHNLPQVPNETIPLAPLSYSDNIESTSYQLRPKKAPAGRVKLEIRQLPDRKIDPVPSGVSDLTYADTLSTAFLESKAYKDAQDLLTGLHNMENALIAKDINNSFKERPNLSLKFVDRDGHFRSYILAYQGVYEETGEPCIYISDFASDRQTSSAGFVLKHFCQRYKENYLDQNNTLPIFAEMRESTSYKLITDNKEMIEGFLGATINIEEIDSYSRGDGEKIHVVKITVNNVNNS